MKFYVGKPRILNKELFLKRVEDILDSGIFANNGPYTEQLEDFIKDYLQVGHAIAVNNATSGLDICLAYLKTKHPFGQIIVPSFTFVASVHAIVRAGFEPVFADIDEDYCLDMDSVDARVNSNTVAIMPVNLFGNYNPPANFAKYRDLFILNDSAQAFGVFIGEENQYAGNFGNCEVTSFHPTKILGSLEAGLITTNNPELANFAVEYRNFGFKVAAGPQGEVVSIGSNYKINEISSACLLTQLENIEEIMCHYHEIYRLYQESLPKWVHLSKPNVYFSNRGYVICRVHPSIRDSLIDYLYEKGIFARTYFKPVHRTGPYIDRYGHLDLPNTNRIAQQVFALPTGLCIEPDSVKFIVDTISKFVS